MITMRVVREKDLEGVQAFLNENNRRRSLQEFDPNHAMIVEDGPEIIGFAYYVEQDEYEIKEIFVHPMFRRKKIGDGLLRALLNLMDRRGISRAVMTVEPTEQAFIDYVGLTPLKDGKYEAKLPDFFEGPCRSEREKGN